MPRAARSFPGLPAGATVQAKILDEDKKEVASEEFKLSARQRRAPDAVDEAVRGADGRRRRRAVRGGGGGGGMPEPRQISGEPRPEANDQPGTYTVRLTYDDLADKTPPQGIAGLPRRLSSRRHGRRVQAKSDAAGRATFTNLDRTGATSYFAMTPAAARQRHRSPGRRPRRCSTRAAACG